MVFNKFGLIVSFLCFLMLSSISMGFDLYGHGVIFYFYEHILNPTDLLFGEIALPRYLSLSYIYEITRRFGIPLGIVVLILVVYPSYHIACKISRNNIRKINIVDFFVIAGVLSLSLFYSGLSLMLLWLAALVLTKKKIFLLGGFFHPVGLVLMTLFILITRMYFVRYFVIMTIFILAFYLFTVQGFFTSSKYSDVRFDLTLNLFDLTLVLEKVIESKINEIIVLIFILIFLSIARSKLKFLINSLRGLFINRVYAISILFVIVIVVNVFFVVEGRHSLLIDTVQFNISDPIYATWFDWGGRDLDDSFKSLYNKRYDDRKYFLD